jgi:ubiquinone/menaquinone biosynthesis C-methylase UbiE
MGSTRLTERFNGLSDLYAKARPSYPQEIIQWCLDLLPTAPKLIVDVGCGTGISTRAFAATGHDTIGIEPNAEMLAAAMEQGPARYQKGSSTCTGMADASSDLIVAAQAFHWFDIPATLREFARIATPHAMCAAFWNIRGMESAFMTGYERLLQKHSTEYEVNERSMRTIVQLKKVLGKTVREHAVDHAVAMDLTRLRSLALSSSYVKHGVADVPAFLAELEELFAAHANEGEVAMHYVTHAIAWPARTPTAP